MGREAKARLERRQKRAAARAKAAPHPEEVLQALNARGQQARREMQASAFEAIEREKMQAAGWVFGG